MRLDQDSCDLYCELFIHNFVQRIKQVHRFVLCPSVETLTAIAADSHYGGYPLACFFFDPSIDWD